MCTMAKYPNEICPKCQKNHRKGRKSEGEQPMQQTFYYEAHLSNQRNPNRYRWKTYRCIDCKIFVMFVEHFDEPKNMKQLNKLINAMTVNIIRLNKNFKYG